MSEENKNEMVVEEVDQDIIGTDVEDKVGDYDHISALQKVVGIIVSPQEALRAIKAKPTIFIPYLIVAIMPVLYMLSIWSFLETAMIIEMEKAMEGSGAGLSRDGFDTIMLVTRITTPLFAAVAAAVGAIVSSGIYFLVCKIFKSSITFKQTLSLVLHVSIIGTLSFVVMVLMTYLTGNNPELVYTSVSSLLPMSMQGTFIYGFLSTVEVFNIWALCVTYLGLVIVAEFKKQSALIVVITLFILSGTFSGLVMLITGLLSGLQ